MGQPLQVPVIDGTAIARIWRWPADGGGHCWDWRQLAGLVVLVGLVVLAGLVALA
jgi:hypothetical protein